MFQKKIAKRTVEKRDWMTLRLMLKDFGVNIQGVNDAMRRKIFIGFVDGMSNLEMYFMRID
jgi:hypothetical protein